MKFLELNKHLLNKSFSPSYCLVGDDSYLIDNAIGQFSSLIQVPELNIVKLLSPQIVNLVDECNSLPIASEYKLVVVHGLSFKAKIAAKSAKKTSLDSVEQLHLLQYLSNPNPATLLLFVDSVLNVDFKDKTIEVDCSKLDEKTLRLWIARECGKRNCGIEQDAIGLLINFCNFDLQRISLEVSKLCSFANGKSIGLDTVRDLVYPDVSFSVFQLSEAVASKDGKKAMQILDVCIKSGEEPVMLLGLLYAHFRRLLFVLLNQNDTRLSANLGIKDYAVRVLKDQSRRFKIAQLRDIVGVFWKMDKDFRDGKFPLDWAVGSAIIQIVQV